MSIDAFPADRRDGRRLSTARAEVVAAARDMLRAGLVVGTVGNVSARVVDGFLITPSRTDYETLEPADVVLLAADGAPRIATPAPAPSREWPLHAAVYAARPEVNAVVHTHSTHATAWSFLGTPLEPELEENEYYAIGPVRTSERAQAGSTELAGNVTKALAGSRAALIGGHGVIAVGDSPAEALVIAKAVEHQAHVAWLLRSA